MSDQFLLIHTTFPDRATAESIAKILVEEKLAACVSIDQSPSTSIYHWEGKIETSDEFSARIKTTQSAFPSLTERLTSLHPYETPEVIATPIKLGENDYLRWISENVMGRNEP